MSSNSAFMVVWGMHRSGTSMLAKAMTVFDADLGDQLFAADQGNERGYFEDTRLMALNNAMLKHLGMSWDSLSAISPANVRSLLEADFGHHALDFLRGKGEAGIIGLKDPRMTRLLPFWHLIFTQAGIKPISLVSYRRPEAVAASLRKRALGWRKPGLVLNVDYGLLLWLGYTLAALNYTRGWPRVLVRYEDLLTRPETILRTIGAKLGLAINENALADFCGQFVDKRLDHFQKDPINLPKEVASLARLIQEAPELDFPQRIPPMWPQRDTDIILTSLLTEASMKLKACEG